MRFAIFEDSKYKIDAVISVLGQNWPQAEFIVARSFQSALKAIETEQMDVVIMDMTLPTTEAEDGKLSGRMRILGGLELMAEIEFLDLVIPVIVLTQFDGFPMDGRIITVKDLQQRMCSEFPSLSRGAIFYGAEDVVWASELTKKVTEVIEDENSTS